MIVLVSIVVLDQITKHVISTLLSANETIPVIKNIFHITLVQNTGIAFGLFRNQTPILIAVSIITIGLIAYNLLARKKDKQFHFNEQRALFLILGGAIGNLIDRLAHGYVIDFLDFRIWPVFNIADSAITIGIILLLFQYIRSWRPIH
ncbi:signal peptidase II [Candidatus Omnitrophota bacterium]